LLLIAHARAGKVDSIREVVMPKWVRHFAIRLGLTATVCAAVASAQTAGSPGVTSSRVVSPAVVATWSSGFDAAVRPQLELLVLWRGSPGWFSSGAPLMTGGGVAGRLGPGGLSGGSRSEHVYAGGLDLEVTVDSRTHVARLCEHAIALGTTNVVLVDDVDGANGPRITGTLWVDPQLQNPNELQAIIQRSSQLQGFLRCDVELADPIAQRTMTVLCDQMMRK
jgi:hypothetical protein